MSILDRVDSPSELKRLTLAQLERLAVEIRGEIVETTSRTGGHVAPNLGVVELTLALHYVYQSPRDKLFWDVGHQCYSHKILTGRKSLFYTLRQFKGISGFPKKSESEHDVFDSGHSGDSISAALGHAVGARLAGREGRSIAIIGDGSVVTGMAFEALNHAGELKQKLVVVLNDNEMSIARSTGAMSAYLNRIITGGMYNRMRADVWNLLGMLPRDMSGRARVAARKIEEGMKNLVVPSLLFEELGFRYVGPVDGHNIPELVHTFRRIEPFPGPVLVHVVTRKGKGFQPALERPEDFHGVGPFDGLTGARPPAEGDTYMSSFGRKMVELASGDDRVVAITAGMCLGTGLSEFREKFPNRFFDVGICEQHAVTFGAGLALAGMRPVVAIYSTFLQRAIDQIIEDVCLQGLPVVFAVDRAGLVGEDGPTHHGTFDLSYLSMIPRLVVAAPGDEPELCEMLELALGHQAGPVAIRYPRGGSAPAVSRRREPVALGKAEVVREGPDGCVFALGAVLPACIAAAQTLASTGLELTVVNARFAKPLDRGLVLRLAERHRRVVTVEEGVLSGGFGAAVSSLVGERLPGVEVRNLGLPDAFVEHAPRRKLMELVSLTPEALLNRFQDLFGTDG
ncbi:MAG: 1-deoxy-D-xylulose-5-phosphate synthase [candidate division WOR-3 bacterium]|nr:MAG: 1-deoxy-D-xylulose-5-phosphate synthase [candidate division WOR-3 bacterium]